VVTRPCTRNSGAGFEFCARLFHQPPTRALAVPIRINGGGRAVLSANHHIGGIGTADVHSTWMRREQSPKPCVSADVDAAVLRTMPRAGYDSTLIRYPRAKHRHRAVPQEVCLGAPGFDCSILPVGQSRCGSSASPYLVHWLGLISGPA